MKRASIFLIVVALIAGMAGCTPPSQDLEIRTWRDLDNVRNNLAGHHTLMNDLDSTTPGYEEVASPTANGGKGWQPIGYGYWAGTQTGLQVFGEIFKGAFDGQGMRYVTYVSTTLTAARRGFLALLVKGELSRMSS
jgi:hypothetical protein